MNDRDRTALAVFAAIVSVELSIGVFFLREIATAIST